MALPLRAGWRSFCDILLATGDTPHPICARHGSDEPVSARQRIRRLPVLHSHPLLVQQTAFGEVELRYRFVVIRFGTDFGRLGGGEIGL